MKKLVLALLLLYLALRLLRWLADDEAATVQPRYRDWQNGARPTEYSSDQVEALFNDGD